jgi:hypothetical protein
MNPFCGESRFVTFRYSSTWDESVQILTQSYTYIAAAGALIFANPVPQMSQTMLPASGRVLVPYRLEPRCPQPEVEGRYHSPDSAEAIDIPAR